VRVDRKKEFTNKEASRFAKNIFRTKGTILLRNFAGYNFTGYRSKNNFVGLSKYINKFCWNFKNNTAKSFDILATGLSVLHNYFDNSTKLFF